MANDLTAEWDAAKPVPLVKAAPAENLAEQWEAAQPAPLYDENDPEQKERDRLFASKLGAFKAVKSGIAPEQAAQVMSHASTLDIPASIAASDPGFTKQCADQKQLEEHLAGAPVLANWAAQDPVKASLIRDDSANLSGIERWLGKGSLLGGDVFGRQWVEPLRLPGETGSTRPTFTPPFWAAKIRDSVNAFTQQLYHAKDYERRMVGLPSDEQDRAYADSLTPFTPAARNYGLDEISSPVERGIAKGVGWVADQAAMTVGAIGVALVGAESALAMGTEALAAGVSSNIIRNTGAGAFGYLFNYGIMGGDKYAANRQQLKAAGKEGDPEAEKAALANANEFGTAAGLVGSFGSSPFNLMQQRLAGEGIALSVPRLLQNETIPRVMGRYLQRFGLHWLEGISTMSTLGAMGAAADEAMHNSLTGDSFDGAAAERVGSAFLQSAEESAIGIGLLSLHSVPVREFMSDFGRANALRRSANDMAKAAEASQASKTIERAPDQAASLVQRMADSGGKGTVLLEKAEFDRLYQEQGVDPREVAAQAMGDSGKAYDEASATGGDIAVPAGTYFAKLARTKDGLKLGDIARFSQDELSPRQQRAEAERVAQKIKAQAEEAIKDGEKAPIDQIREDFTEKALAAGSSESQARTNAEIVARAFTWFGAKTSRDPMELYQTELPLEVFGPGGEKAKGHGLAQPRYDGPLPPDVADRPVPPVNVDADRMTFSDKQGRDAMAKLKGVHVTNEHTGLDVLFAPRGMKKGQRNQSPAGKAVIPDLPEIIRNAASIEPVPPRDNNLGVDKVLRLLGVADIGGVRHRVIVTLEHTKQHGTRYHDHEVERVEGPAAASEFSSAGGTVGGSASSERGVPDLPSSPLPRRPPNTPKVRDLIVGGKWNDHTRVTPDEIPAPSRGAHKQEGVPLPEGGAVRAKPGRERGFIQLEYGAETGAPVKAEIHLANPDPSTLPHELMHFFVEVMGKLSERPEAEPSLRDSYQTILRTMGYASQRERQLANQERRELSALDKRTPQQAARLKELTGREERVTHAWEQYLLEGKAPSRELMPIFARFKGWLKRVYGSVVGIQDQYRQKYGEDLELSEDLRNVFRRMLAGDEATEDASRSFDAERPQVKLTPEEQQESDRLIEESRVEAEAKLQRQLIEEERGADKEFMRSERERITKEVDAEVGQEQPYAAIDMLSGGETIGKLDRESVVREHGEEVAKALPKEIFAAREGEGLAASDAADLLGFKDGADLVNSIMGAEPREQRVKREARQRVSELYPPLAERPAALAEAAKAAGHNDALLREGLLRLRAMAREAGIEPGVTSEKALKAAAENYVTGKKLSELQPSRFDAAAKSAARRCVELKDPQKRVDAWEAYLLNRAMYRAALDAQEQAGKIAKHLELYTRDKMRAKVGKAIVYGEELPDGSKRATQPYLDQIDNLLDAFEFRRSVSMKEVRSRDAQRAALEQWVNERWADGDSVIVPESVMENLQRSTHWKDLSLSELSDLRDAVDSIAQQADLRTKFTVGGQQVAMERVAQELIDSAHAHGAGLVTRLTGREPIGEKLGSAARRAKQSVERPELLLRELDGHKEGGPWTKYIWNTISDASYRYHDLVRKTSASILDLLRSLPAKERVRLQGTFKEDGIDFTQENVVAALLNCGNESNMSKLIRGMSDPRNDYFRAPRWNGRGTLDKVLAHATAKDVELVNTIHAALEAYWPEAVRVEVEDCGLAPKKVQTRPFRFRGADGEELEIKGGYYPLLYAKVTRVGKTQAESRNTVGLSVFNRDYEQSITPQGHLAERVENFTRPFDLSLNALPRHIAMTSKDIAFRLPAKQVYRVLTDERVAGALTQAVGEKGYNVILKHLQDSVNDVMLPDPGAAFWVRAIHWARKRTTESIFALNVGQAFQNLADLTGVADVVPVHEVAKASLRLACNREEEVAAILEKSPEMRLRADGMSSSMAHQLEQSFHQLHLGPLEVERGWEKFKDFCMTPFEVTQSMTEYPTWLGAYEHATKAAQDGGLGLSEAEAIRHADTAVRDLFGGKRTVDLPPVMRDKIMRELTMFYGWANAQLNIFLRALGRSQSEWGQGARMKAAGIILKTCSLLMVKNLVSELLVGNAPEKDKYTGERDWAGWAAYKSVMMIPSEMPVVGSGVRALEDKQSRDISLTPWTRGIGALADAIITTAKATGDRAPDDAEFNAFLAWLQFGGQLAGAPVSQLRTSARYWSDPSRDPYAPAWQDVLGTGWGRSKGKTLSNLLSGQ